ncbi:MAG: hypothetical protein H7067_13850, partial [Burkholderiales bacterium]|nr:hypothetical protein [Opitutaceae bacterium]
DRAVVRRPGSAPLEITREGAGIYVAAVRLDNRTLDRSWLRHAELAASTRLAFTMSETPTAWGRTTPPPQAAPLAP